MNLLLLCHVSHVESPLVFLAVSPEEYLNVEELLHYS
jgi:hypothetical protein